MDAKKIKEIEEMMEEMHNNHFCKVLEMKHQSNRPFSFLGDNETLEYLINTQKTSPELKH